MRIDILPNNAAPISGRESQMPEAEQEHGGSTFLEVIDQLAASGGPQKQAGKENASSDVEKKNDHLCESLTAPLLPSPLVTPEPQQAPIRCEFEPALASVDIKIEDAAQDPGTAGWAGSAPPPAKLTASVSTRSVPAVALPDATEDDLYSTLLVPATDADVPLDLPAPPATAAPAGTVTSRSQVPAQPEAAPAEAAPQPDLVSASPAVTDVAGILSMTPSETAAGPAAPIDPPAVNPTPGRPGTPSPQAPANAAATGELQPQTGVAPVGSSSEETAIAANTRAVAFSPDIMAPSLCENGKTTLVGFESRDNARETRPSPRRGQANEQAGILTQAPQHPADLRRAAVPAPAAPEVFADPRQGKSESESSHRVPPDAQPDVPQAGKDKSGARPLATLDSAQSAFVDSQDGQRALFCSQPIRTSASETQAYVAFRPFQRGAAMTATSWTAGTQGPQQAAAAELKSLSALLAPRQSGPSQGPDFLSQLAERIQMQLRDGENIIRVQLKPGTLGRMEIRAETSGAGVLATITTESASVRDYLEHNLHLLQQSFQDQGLKVDRINVAVQEGFWPQHTSPGHQESRSGSGQQGESGLPVWPGEPLEMPGEELIVDPQTIAVLNPHSTFHTIA
ncbi:MAG: flagellar hook-length control protein FliK [Acidobacteriia bacterium]|nr:flagellar hook-length control protein FliK [Terriglobia bacterium]